MHSQLPESLIFSSADAESLLRRLPSRQMAVFALHGAENAEPYVGVAADLRRRLSRLLIADAAHPRRLQLAARVQRIAWRVVGSRLEAQVAQFRLLEQLYGARALERMHLRAPVFVRFHGGNSYPRLSITSRIPREHTEWFYGPFASRAAAERYCEEVLKLFLLRRCEENLDPNPSHPGCVYSEMKKCLAPCFQGCAEARYAEEASAVQQFLATRGDSRLRVLAAERDAASAQLEFEQAAALHAAARQVESVRALAPEIVQPLKAFEACLILPASLPDAVAIFLYADGLLRGPEMFSILDMRIQNEGSGSSSLFAQPVRLEPLPEPSPQIAARALPAAQDALATRLDTILTQLRAEMGDDGVTRRTGDLAMLTRWYYRPVHQRGGEIFFREDEAEPRWNQKALLRGIGRVAAAQIAHRAAEFPEPSAAEGSASAGEISAN